MTRRGDRLVQWWAQLLARDPGLLAARRGARGMLSFALMTALAHGVSGLLGAPPLSMMLGFPVSIFGVIVPRESMPGPRFITMVCLIAAAGSSFCASALITHSWLNHLLFVVLVFCVVYARRWGDRANAAGFGAFSSFFLGAFLSPPPSALPLQLLGLALALVAISLVQFVLLPERPAAALARIRDAIALRSMLLLVPLQPGARFDLADGRNPAYLKRQLAKLRAAIRAGKAELDVFAGGWRARIAWSFALFELQTAAERLTRLAVAATAISSETSRRAAVLRGALEQGQPRPQLSPPADALGAALDELYLAHERLVRLPRDHRDPLPQLRIETHAVPPSAATGLSLSTRLAIQASAACALAIVGGELLSPQRWYWAVITVFVLFTGTASRGEALYKGLQRILGTILGVLAGMGLVSLVGGSSTALFLLMLADIWLTYYFFTDRFAVMSFFLTVLLASLFALLGRLSPQLLWVRIEETALGAAASLAVASLLFPRATHENVRERWVELLDAMSELVCAALTGLAQGGGRSLGEPSRKLERAHEALRTSLRPLQLDRFGAGGRLYNVVLEDLEACEYWLHELSLAARVVQPPGGSAALATIERQRQHFTARIRSLRELPWERGALVEAGPDSGDAAALVPAPSSDGRLDAAEQALRQVSAALADLGEAIRHGMSRARAFRF